MRRCKDTHHNVECACTYWIYFVSILIQAIWAFVRSANLKKIAIAVLSLRRHCLPQVELQVYFVLHEKATDIQQGSRQTREQDTNIVPIKVLLEWVYDWPVVYWLQLIISKQRFFENLSREKQEMVLLWKEATFWEKGTTGRKGQKGEREKGGKERQGHKGERETGKGRGSVTPFGGLRTYNANLPAEAAWQAGARRAPHPVSLI